MAQGIGKFIVHLMTVYLIGVMSFCVWYYHEHCLPEESKLSEPIAVFISGTIEIDANRVVYVGEDTRGKQYYVEQRGYFGVFNEGEVPFVRIREKAGRWYISGVIARS